jgi:uncharacterized protein
MDKSRVVDNLAERRYELWLGDELAGFIDYRLSGDTVTMIHTDVDPRHEGEGLGSRLVQDALDDVRARGRLVRPLCPFVAAYIRRHSEYADIVA